MSKFGFSLVGIVYKSYEIFQTLTGYSSNYILIKTN